MGLADVLPQLEDSQFYKDFTSGETPLQIVLRDGNPAANVDDLQDRLRQIGSLTLALEGPATTVLSSESAPQDAKDLAHTVMTAVQNLSNQIAELLVDLSQTKEVVTVLNGKK